MRQKMCGSCFQQMRGTELICPHCRSLQGLTLRAKLGLTLLALFVVSPLVVDSMPSSWGAAANTSNLTSSHQTDPGGVTKAVITAPSARTEHVAAPSPKPKRYVVINGEGSAALHRRAGSVDPVMTRIPSGKRVEVHGQHVDRRGAYPVIYYEVREGAKRGWISQYTTTLEIILVDPTSGRETVRMQRDGARQFARRFK